MPVRVTLDAVLATRRMTAKELARRVGLSETQLSMLRTGKVRGMRFSTMAAVCAVLDCQPGELLSYTFDASDIGGAPDDAVDPE
ncbi:MAG TPA: helix-turn-helix transcriptional regulator [Lysobacter sp.]|nr:helix-turn-helix transcriptional regulator [Lysobacter sp.]